MFFFKLMSGYNALSWASIMVDNQKKVGGHAYQAAHNNHGHGSNMAVTECAQGQRVWVRGIGSGNIFDNYENYATFSGILLYVN